MCAISFTHFRGSVDSPLGSTFMRLNEYLALRTRHLAIVRHLNQRVTNDLAFLLHLRCIHIAPHGDQWAENLHRFKIIESPHRSVVRVELFCLTRTSTVCLCVVMLS